MMSLDYSGSMLLLLVSANSSLEHPLAFGTSNAILIPKDKEQLDVLSSGHGDIILVQWHLVHSSLPSAKC